MCYIFSMLCCIFSIFSYILCISISIFCILCSESDRKQGCTDSMVLFNALGTGVALDTASGAASGAGAPRRAASQPPARRAGWGAHFVSRQPPAPSPAHRRQGLRLKWWLALPGRPAKGVGRVTWQLPPTPYLCLADHQL